MPNGPEPTALWVSIPKRPGRAAQPELSNLMEKLRDAEGLLGLAGFAVGQRFRIVLLTNDPDRLRSFLRSEGLRARQGRAVVLEPGRSDFLLAQLEQWAYSGADVRGFGALASSKRRVLGFVEESIH